VLTNDVEPHLSTTGILDSTGILRPVASSSVSSRLGVIGVWVAVLVEPDRLEPARRAPGRGHLNKTLSGNLLTVSLDRVDSGSRVPLHHPGTEGRGRICWRVDGVGAIGNGSMAGGMGRGLLGQEVLSELPNVGLLELGRNRGR
jgi:hypothetical protein